MGTVQAMSRRATTASMKMPLSVSLESVGCGYFQESITVTVPTLAPGLASLVVTVGTTQITVPSQFTVTLGVKEYIHLGGRVIAIENQ